VTTPPADRVEQLVSLMSRLAAGELHARQEPSDANDDIDAVIVGVNMLAEELEASHAELEARVTSRTREVEQLNKELVELTQLASMLQSCATREEAYAVLRHGMSVLFSGLSGVLYLFNASRNMLEKAVDWEDVKSSEVVKREDCWGLRRGQPHEARQDGLGLRCAHIEPGIGDSVCIPLAAHGETTGLLYLTERENGAAASAQVLTESMQQLGMAVGAQIALSFANLELRETLRLQALRDPLTGLFNRRFLDEWIDREINRADHAGASLGVIMADVDHFKDINDVHGHDAGDQVLTAVANAIRGSLRAGDVPCRYGGEEFLILVTDITLGDLTLRAEALKANVSRCSAEHRGILLPAVTISAGVALYPLHGSGAADVIKAADTALYAAKHQGRNRVNAAPKP
jgi:diguanylate cyclase (GGDEF)-like protein